MKTRLLAIILLAATAATIAFYPTVQSNTVKPIEPDITLHQPLLPNQRPQIEVVFVLDTTGSMGGLLSAAKEKIWSIATTMASAESAPEIKIGLVAYRDRGDAYVTQVIDLSDDLDSVYAKLMDFQARGGGDGPESVNKALYDAVHKISWSTQSDAYKVVFLVGDAPPHMDYPDDVKYPETIKAANAKGIVINTIQCGRDGVTAGQWQKIASLSQGDFFNVAQDGNAIAVLTPFDEKIAVLSAKLDDTRMYFGSVLEKAQSKRKVEATNKLHAGASFATRARRATFNSSASGAKNAIGENELVDAVIAGRVDLDEMDVSALPQPLQTMAPEERKKTVAKQADKRAELQLEIGALVKARESYIAEEVAGKEDLEESLDHQLYRTIKRQAAVKGLMYESAPKY